MARHFEPSNKMQRNLVMPRVRDFHSNSRLTSCKLHPFDLGFSLHYLDSFYSHITCLLNHIPVNGTSDPDMRNFDCVEVEIQKSMTILVVVGSRLSVESGLVPARNVKSSSPFSPSILLLSDFYSCHVTFLKISNF